MTGIGLGWTITTAASDTLAPCAKESFHAVDLIADARSTARLLLMLIFALSIVDLLMRLGLLLEIATIVAETSLDVTSGPSAI